MDSSPGREVAGEPNGQVSVPADGFFWRVVDGLAGLILEPLDRLGFGITRLHWTNRRDPTVRGVARHRRDGGHVDDRRAPRRHKAAEWAEFAPYELVEPTPVTRRARSFGFSAPDTVSELSIEFEVADGRIEVSTRVPDQGTEAHVSEALVPDLLNALHPWSLALPVALRIEPAERDVSVDGAITRFRGVAIVDQRLWVGRAELAASSIQISVRGAETTALVIATCRDLGAIAPY